MCIGTERVCDWVKKKFRYMLSHLTFNKSEAKPRTASHLFHSEKSLEATHLSFECICDARDRWLSCPVQVVPHSD